MQPDTKFIHGMKDLCAELDKRIGRLQKFQARVQERVDNNIQVEKNSQTLAQINKTLMYSLQARKAMEDGCCVYECPFELY